MKKPKKLLIFTGHFLPYVGGLESHVDELARGLSGKGVKVTVFSSNIPKTKKIEKKNSLYDIIRYPAFQITEHTPIPKFWSREFRDCLKKIKKEQYDIIMSRTRFFFSSFVAFLFAKKNKIRFVHVEHGSSFVRTGNWFVDFAAWVSDQTIGRIIMSKADITIAISSSVKKFVSLFKKGNIPIITRGVDFNFLDKIKPDNQFVSKNSLKNKVIVGSACRIMYWKGVHNALEGFSGLPDKIKQKAVFVVIGDGEGLRDLKKKCNSTKILFLGSKTRRETLALMKTFNIYVHSSISGGGLSNSLLEAMSANNAIIGTPAEGAVDVLRKDNSIIIAKSDPLLFRKAFQKLIPNKGLQKELAANAQRFVRENFQWDKKVEQYMKLLHL